jgi:subtilisin family serine protease
MKSDPSRTNPKRFLSLLRVAAAGSLFVLAAALFAQATLDQVEPLTPAPAPDYTTHVEGTNLWFVQLQSAPRVKGTSLAKLNAEKQAFRKAAADAEVSYTERYAYSKLWNGFSIRVNASQLSTISRLPGVKGVYPVNVIQVPKASGPSPDLETALAMTGADIAQSGLGFTGTGIKVAVMDTGLDYDHADLGGDGVTRSNSSVFPTARVTHGFDFVGDSYNASSSSPAYQPVPQPDAFPDDCNGHGTHVSGIVGASGNFGTGGARGVAPGVTFGAYRVFGCEGSTTDDVMIAAMERIADDGMHVLNMSIGDAFNNWPGSPTSVAADNLVDAGVVVVASIGNSGANGVWSAGAPGVGNKVIGVASYDNSHVKLPTFTVTPANITAGYSNAAAAPAAPTTGSLPLAKTGTPATTNDGCNAVAPAPGSLTGQAVLIRRGTCSFYEKSRNAQLAGAAAVVLYNNVAGRINPTVALDPAAGPPQDPIGIPVVAISDTEGVAINNAINGGAQTLNWTDDEGTFANATGGLISSFSSYGLAADLTIKPDIGAPGGLIRSTYPLENGGYATISGTSMASPHVAGAAALFLQAKGWTTLNPAQAASVCALLQNTSVPAVWSGNPGLGFLDFVHRQGAGMLKIDKAILAPASVSPGKLVQGEAGLPVSHTLNVTNNTASAITYDLSHQGALSTSGSTFAPGATTSGAAAGGPITFSSPSLLVPANSTASVIVTIPRPNFGVPNRVVYGGYIRFTPQGGGQILRVPYGGFGADYQGITILTSGGATPPFPKLAQRAGWVSAANFTPTYTFPAGPITYTMEQTMMFGRPFRDFPTVGIHFDHQARWLRITVLDAAGNPVVSGSASQTLDPVATQVDLHPRNSTAGGFFAYDWDGRLIATHKNGHTISKNMPNGDYKLRVQVLKALGTEPTDVETYTSPTFTIARP